MPEEIVMTDEPIFRPTGMDHVVLNVKDLDSSAAFYQKFIGTPERRGNRVWFQVGASRIGLQQMPAGQRPGVFYFCVTAAAFNIDAATRRLQQAGARWKPPRAPEPCGFAIWTDT